MAGNPASLPEHYETARSKAARLHARLREEILAGVLRPGDALSENLLAEQTAISRTPVREVLHRLSAEGLLRVVPQIGSFVAPINLAAVTDSQFVREALECQAVRQAAAAITRAQASRLGRQIEAQQARIAAGDTAGFFALDEAMHRMILEIAGRATVWQVIAGVKAQLDRVRHLSLQDATWPAMLLSQHQEIAARLIARDAEGAAAAMAVHLRTVFAAIARIAAAHADFFETASPTTQETR
ncbi:MAG: GntR family transcriptional regulator [Rhodospirillales bacterium]|nr:GntR family transcriptional regulator [Rhodospirillales bacterium]